MTKQSVRPSGRRTRRGLASAGVLGLVGGAGLLGVAALAPSAGAATELVYTCNTAVGPQDVTVAIDSNAPASGAVGSPVTVSAVTGKITLPGSLGNAMAGALGFQSVSVVTPNTVTISGPDGTSTQNVQLNTAKTTIYGSTWVNDGTYGGFAPDGHLVLPLAGAPNTSVTPKTAGTYTISAPDSFTSTFTGYKGTGATENIESACTYKSGNKVVDSITVTAAAPSPTSTSTTASPTSTSTTSSPTSTSTSPTSTSTTASPTSTSTTASPTSTSTTAEPTSPETSSTSSTSTGGEWPSDPTTEPTTDAPTSSPTATSTDAPAPTSTASSTAVPTGESSTATATGESSSAAVTTPATTPGSGSEGPKVETDYVNATTVNFAGMTLVAAGAVALGGAAFSGRRARD